MPIALSIKSDLKDLIKKLDARRNQLPFAIAKTLTDLAKETKNKMPAHLETDLDRPKDFTKKGMFITPANKTTLRSVVGFKDRQAKYLAPQIAGGARQPKAFEVKIPGAGRMLAMPGAGAKLDRYGNISKANLLKYLELVKAPYTSGTGRARKGVQRGQRSYTRAFIGKPSGGRRPLGLWVREANNSKLVPVLVFVSRAAYRARFKFRQHAEKIVKENVEPIFRRNYATAIATAKVLPAT